MITIFLFLFSKVQHLRKRSRPPGLDNACLPDSHRVSFWHCKHFPSEVYSPCTQNANCNRQVRTGRTLRQVMFHQVPQNIVANTWSTHWMALEPSGGWVGRVGSGAYDPKLTPRPIFQLCFSRDEHLPIKPSQAMGRSGRSFKEIGHRFREGLDKHAW